MEIKDLLKSIATIYEHDPARGEELARQLYKAIGDGSDDDKPAERKRFGSDWAPTTDLTPEQQDAIKELMDSGYSEREAHRDVGTHSENHDFSAAVRSSVRPSMMSDKRINELKSLAKEWLENADRHEKLNADIEKNPMKHAAGQLMSAHEQHMGDYTKAYNEFLQSDELKDLSPIERHKKVSQWKKDFRASNPSHAESIANASSAQTNVPEARQAAKQSLNDRLSHILSGGGFSPDESHSTEAGMQHAGIQPSGKEEGAQAAGTTQKDPFTAFGESNKKLLGMLSEEQKDRLKRVNNAAAIQGKQPNIETQPKTEAPPKPKMIIRRRSTTDAKE